MVPKIKSDLVGMTGIKTSFTKHHMRVQHIPHKMVFGYRGTRSSRVDTILAYSTTADEI
jgi:hypothetical protein